MIQVKTTMDARNILIMVFLVLVSSTAQVFLKTGMKEIGQIHSLELNRVFPLLLSIAVNWRIIFGLTMYVIGTFFWLVLLSRVDLSLLYPFGAMQYAFVFLFSYFLLGEHIGWARIGGAGIILFGIFVISKWG